MHVPNHDVGSLACLAGYICNHHVTISKRVAWVLVHTMPADRLGVHATARVPSALRGAPLPSCPVHERVHCLPLLCPRCTLSHPCCLGACTHTCRGSGQPVCGRGESQGDTQPWVGLLQAHRLHGGTQQTGVLGRKDERDVTPLRSAGCVPQCSTPAALAGSWWWISHWVSCTENAAARQVLANCTAHCMCDLAVMPTLVCCNTPLPVETPDCLAAARTFYVCCTQGVCAWNTTRAAAAKLAGLPAQSEEEQGAQQQQHQQQEVLTQGQQPVQAGASGALGNKQGSGWRSGHTMQQQQQGGSRRRGRRRRQGAGGATQQALQTSEQRQHQQQEGQQHGSRCRCRWTCIS
jgi:hypothetical protein